MKIKITNTSGQPIHYTKQYEGSLPRTVKLSDGESIYGHAITYNADKGSIILTNKDFKCYFEINDSVTHTIE